MMGAILTTSLGVTFQGAPVQAAPIEGALVLQASLYFSTFKSLHNKTYPSEAENTARFEVFKENLAYIEAENSKGHPYKLGIGPFTDLTESEFLTLYTGTPNEPQQHGGPLYLGEHQTPVEEEPEEKLDWTTKGAVTPVKNQARTHPAPWSPCPGPNEQPPGPVTLFRARAARAGPSRTPLPAPTTRRQA